MSTQIVHSFPVLPPEFQALYPTVYNAPQTTCTSCGEVMIADDRGKSFLSCPHASQQCYDWTQRDAKHRICTKSDRNISPVFVKHYRWQKY